MKYIGDDDNIDSDQNDESDDNYTNDKDSHDDNDGYDDSDDKYWQDACRDNFIDTTTCLISWETYLTKLLFKFNVSSVLTAWNRIMRPTM